MVSINILLLLLEIHPIELKIVRIRTNVPLQNTPYRACRS